MSLLPVITPRSSTALQQNRLLYQVNSDQTRLQTLYDQLSTGRRVLSASQDPAAAARALSLSAGISHAEQMTRNAAATASFLQTADTAIGNINELLIEARGASVTAAQGVLGDGERLALTEELDQMLNRIVMLGNEAFQQTSVFGGALFDGSAFVAEADGVIFNGNQATATPKLAAETQIATLTTATEALGVADTVIRSHPLERALTAETRLVDMRDGLGVSPGLLRLNNGSGWIDVDLRGSVTLGDIKDRIEAVDFAGRSLALDIQADSVTLRYADNLNGTLGVDDAPGSSTSQQLNIYNPQSIVAPPLTGAGLAPKMTKSTPLSELNNGAGIDVSAGIRIEHGSERFDINMATAETVDDVLTAINRSGAEVRAELDETTGEIRLRPLKSGVDYSVGELGGNAATELGLRTLSTDKPLAELQRGRGPRLTPSGTNDLEIERPDGTILGIDGSGLNTIQDVIDAIANHPANQDADAVIAELAPFGNGLRLSGPAGAGDLVVRQLSGSDLGETLGLIPENAMSATGQDVAGVSELVGRDPAPVEPGGAIDSLMRLRRAVADSDDYEIERMSARLEGDLKNAVEVRGAIGFRARTVDTLKTTAEDQVVLMKSRYSEEIEADVTEVISSISARQSAMEASLQLMGRTAGLTVLDFL